MKKLILTVALILTMGVSVHAAAMPYPTIPLPYVPPSEVGVYDTLFNASGVTAIDESDEAKRLRAYIDLFRMAIGVNTDVFIGKMKEVAENAKTTAQISMDADTATKLQQAVKYALQNGVTITEQGTDFPSYNVFKTYYQQNVSSNTYPQQTFYDRFKQYALNHPDWKIMLGYNAGARYPHAIISQNQGWTGFSSYEFKSPCLILFDTASESVTQGGQTYTWTIYRDTTQTFNNLAEFIERVNVTTEIKQIAAKDTATQQAITSGKNAILTADSELTQSDTVDTTKPVVINIYRTINYPATTVEDVDEKQRELVVTNISTDEVATTEKATLEDVRAEIYGEAESYRLDLISFFPFCIPRDIMLLLQAFSAEPVTPEIDIPFPNWENGEMTTIYYNLSLSQFDNLAGALRGFEIVAFMIGLLAVTRQKYLRG